MIFLVIPAVNVIVSSILYYTWRHNQPRRAGQINGLGFAVFGSHVLIGIVVAIGFGIADGTTSGGPKFEQYANNLIGFKILMPGKPRNTEFPDKLGRRWHVFSIKVDDVEYSVAMYELNKEDDADRVLEPPPSDDPSKPVKTERIMLAGRHPGISIERPGVVPGTFSRQRMYVVARRVYIVIAAGEPDAVRSPHVTKFHDSFQVLEALRPTRAPTAQD